MKLKTLKNNIQLLTEDIYSAPQSRRAIKYLMREGGYSKEQAKQVIDGLMHDLEIHHSKDPKFKFMLGLARLFVTGQLNDEQNISRMKTYLKYLSSEGHNDENKKNGYNEDINGENLQDLSRKFDSLISSDNEKSRDEVNSIDFGNSDYNIVRIDSERQCRKYGKYTSWCITHGSFKQYSLDSFNQCYFCLKPGFENVRRPENPTDAPFDEYGLSMLSVIVDENGNPKYITTRYNHDYEGENNPELCTAKQVSQLIGVNFYETFKPNNKWKELIETCKQRIQNGENPEDVFDYCGNFFEGFAVVELNGKGNFINKNGNYLSRQWFEDCGDFIEGFAVVELNNKRNFINTDDKIISKQWFDECYSFNEGFAVVELNNKRNFINKDGNILSKQWFDFCGYFHEGFAEIELNGKWNFINKDGKIISKQWFDYCGNFFEGFIRIELNDKWNFINKDGKYLSEQWFDNCYNFYNGFADVKLNGTRYKIGKNGKLYDNNGEPIQESIKRIKKVIITEEQYRNLIFEDIYSAPQNRRAIKYLMRKGGYSNEQAKQVIDGLMHDLEIHHSKDPKFKFMLGLSRLFVTGQLNDEQNISRMKTYLKYLSSEGHNDENKKNGYNEDINGENIQDLARKFDSLISSDNEKSRDEVNSIDFGNSDYNIVRIDSERQCRKYGKYTSWCITHGSFKQYSLDSFNQCYFCLKPGFENIQRPNNPTDAPFDEYGLSMISVIVDENGNPKYITTRYNHDYDGENNPKLRTAKQVSQLIGVNFYSTFRPSNKWKELAMDCEQRIQNGENPKDVFDYCYDFHEGFAKVYLNNKRNFINTDGKIISKQWFDYCGNFFEGFTRIELNNKWNFINTDGKLVSKEWFNGCYNFYNGFAGVNLNNKCNFINTDGNILSEQWFDYCYDFSEGFANVNLNNKYNFINTDGKILSKQWFDFCGDFHEGFAFVKLNGKNYKIDKNGKLTISEIKESYNRGENVLKRYDASNKQLYTRTKCVTMCNNHLRQDDFINVFFINRLIRDKKIYPKGSTIYKGKTVSLYNFWDILRIYSTVSQFNSKQNAEFFLKNCKNDYMYIPEKNVLLMKKRSMDEKAKEQFDKKEKEKQRYESAVNNRARYDSSELDDKNN